MANDSTTAYDPRQIWAANLAPLVTAAREGAAHAARTASRERARARGESQWWRQRWLIVAAAGLVVVGAAGGAYAAMAKRRSATDDGAEGRRSTGASDYGPAGPTERILGRTEPASGPGSHAEAGGIRSTMEAGRDKVADLARTVAHKFRGDGSDHLSGDGADRMAAGQPAPASSPALAATAPDESRNDARPADRPYHGQF